MSKKIFEFIPSVYFLICTIAVAITMISCGRGLSRDEAGEIISKSTGLPKPIYFYLPVGISMEDPRSSAIETYPPTLKDEIHGAWSKLESLGYIKFKDLGKKTILGTPIVELSLTDKGKGIFTHDREHFWKAEICKKVFVEITGISINEDKVTAVVEYTWKYDNFSPIFQVVLLLSDLSSGVYGNVYSLNKTQVMMRKYDDGWRIVT